MIINKVYKFGCRAPRNEAIALQLLGQASNYREDLRRVYNNNKKQLRRNYSANAEASHVKAFEEYNAKHDEVGHVYAFERSVFWGDSKDRVNEQIREARANRGHLLDAGTYWLIEASVLAASKASGNDLIKPQDFDWTGRIGAMIASTEKFPANKINHKRVTLVPNPESTNPKFQLLNIKVGELKDNRTITWAIKMDRSFPPDAIVKQVAIQRIRYGHRFRWEALFTIAFDEVQKNTEVTGTVGIDIGWREEEKGKRVATWNGSDGKKDKLYIDTLESFEYSDSIQSIRDSNFDLCKEYVVRTGIPGGEHANLWKDKSRMYRLGLKTNDFGIRWWIERDKHLEDIECGVRKSAQRRRLDKYRKFADFLAQNYKYVALEDMPMTDWVGEGETHERERKRSSAALYLLQLVISQRFGTDRCDWVPPEYTSMICSVCGCVRDNPVGPNICWTCECGYTHDQDENAAIIIRIACETQIADKNTVRARKRKASKTIKKNGGMKIAA